MREREWWLEELVEARESCIRGHFYMKANQGSSLMKKVGESLNVLVDFARKRVPKEYWGKTEIRLMVNAGLRLVDGHVQEGMLDACWRVLRLSGFKFSDHRASVISARF